MDMNMIRFLSSLLLLFALAAPSFGAAQLVQLYASSATPTAVAGESAATWGFPLPNNVGAGNAIVCALTYPDSTAPTVSDNNGNTWTGTLAITTTSGGNDTTVWVLPNANAGTTKITFIFGAAQQPVWGECQEWSGIATSTPVNGTVGTGAVSAPNLATGSFTPVNNNANGGAPIPA